MPPLGFEPTIPASARPKARALLIYYKFNMLHIRALYHIKEIIISKRTMCILSSLYKPPKCFNHAGSPSGSSVSLHYGCTCIVEWACSTDAGELAGIRVYPDPGKFSLPLSGVRSQWHVLAQLYKCSPSVTKLFSLKMTRRGRNMYEVFIVKIIYTLCVCWWLLLL
jgi:hypothetical protein